LRGVAPGKRYHCIIANGETSSDFRELEKGTTYYFAIEALGEAGRSEMGKEVEVK